MPVHSKIPLDTTHEIFLPLLLLRSQRCCENQGLGSIQKAAQTAWSGLDSFACTTPLQWWKENGPTWFSDSNLNFHVRQLGTFFPPHPTVKLTNFLCRSLKVNKCETQWWCILQRDFSGWKYDFKSNILDPLLCPLISAYSKFHFVLPDLTSSVLSGKSHCLWQYHYIGIHISVAEYKHLYEHLVNLVLDLFYSKHKYPCSCAHVPAPKRDYAMLYMFYICTIRSKSPHIFFQRFARLFFLFLKLLVKNILSDAYFSGVFWKVCLIV